MPISRTLIVVTCLISTLQAEAAERSPPHNVILFVPDGLRALKVTAETAPAMAELRDKGVNFANPHSLFPTFTTANASGMATGHHVGDTGDFSNTIYSGFPVSHTGGSVTPFLENDAVLGDVDAHFAGDYLDEDTVLKAARARGISTAAIGKVGPALMFDHTERSGQETVLIDDATGSPSGIALSDEIKARLTAAGLPLTAPTRGENGKAVTTVPNTVQQAYFADVATKVVLPLFKDRKRPFVLVFWSRDPDGTQHNQGDSLGEVTPGINGPTSLAAIKNADDNLRQIRQALTDLGLAATTDIIVAADHGFSTIAKDSQTSAAAKMDYPGVPKGTLPSGFLAIDIAKALALPLFDPDKNNAAVGANAVPARGNGLIGRDAAKPDAVVAANGGSDLIYLPNKDRAMAANIVKFLLGQDYVSGLFVDDSLGRYSGTLPLTAINMKGRAVTPTPAIVVNFRSFATGCPEPVLCTAEIADTALQQGQGMHGSFSRADTMNFMAAIGPDFKAGFVNKAPVSNADVGKTMMRLLSLRLSDRGRLVGRVMGEALKDGRTPAVVTRIERSEPAEGGLRTVLKTQKVGGTRYFDAAGFLGRTVGIETGETASR